MSQWTDVPGPVEYVYSGVSPSLQTLSVNLTTATNYTVDNLPNLELRWKFYFVSGVGTTGCLLTLDEISVTSNANTGLTSLVLQNESFESTTIFPAPGWRTQKVYGNINGNFLLQNALTAVNPVCGASPGGGNNLMMLNSYSANMNDTTYMITKPFDFSNNGGTNPMISFYMFRDNGFLAQDDKVQLYINTVPSITGATLLTNTLGTTEILRRYNANPGATPNTWNLYTYSLSAATYTGKRYYFILAGICRDGNNIYID